jgi:dCTP deaminase
MSVKSDPVVLSDKDLRDITAGAVPLITHGQDGRIAQDQIQPSSLDLTIGGEVFGMGRASLPQEGQPVSGLIEECQYRFVRDEGFLHRGYTYIVPLAERVALPAGFSAKFSPKSSTGRTDTFVRILADGVPRFDYIPEGYEGGLYLEITPLSFPIEIRSGLSLVQMRIRHGDPRLTGRDVAIMHSREGVFLDKHGVCIPTGDLKLAEHGVYLHVDLDRDIVGVAARTNVRDALVLYKTDFADPLEYWEQIRRPKNGLTLDPDRFYLLATKERVRIPNTICGDMAPYDASTGEFRTHYAGFFDPGFGGSDGTTGVLEVRGREMPHRLFDNDPICLMVFERVSQVEKPYQGNYQNPGPSLSKHFKRRYEMWERLIQ